MRRPCPRRRQRGIAVLELALTVPMFMALLAYAVFFGRMLYNYQVIQKAAYDSARYLAGAPAVNMGPERYASEIAVAQQIIAAEVSGLRPARGDGPIITILCDGGNCSGDALPTEISVEVRVTLRSDVFDYYAPYISGAKGIRVVAKPVLRYVGN